MTTQIRYADKTVVANGIRLHYLEWGDAAAPMIVALHGLRGHGHSWDSFSEAMCGDYHILALDQRGRGETDWAPDGDYSGEAYVRDLEGLCAVLKLDNFILMGHSMGGRNSMLFAGRHPSMVNRLIIVDIGPDGDPAGGARIKREIVAAQEEYDSFEALLQRQLEDNRLISPELMRRRLTYQTKRLPNGKVGWRYDLEIRQQWREDRRPAPEDLWQVIPAIPCPTLIVRGTETDVLPLPVAQRMVEVMPRAEVVQVEQAAHMVMEENPSEFNQVVREFLQGSA